MCKYLRLHTYFYPYLVDSFHTVFFLSEKGPVRKMVDRWIGERGTYVFTSRLLGIL